MDRFAAIGRYRKLFGTGPLAYCINFCLLGLMLLLDRELGRIEILDDPKPLRILGLVFIALWICWHSWAIKTIRGWWIGNRLCTTGPFRFVRHPMYAGGILLADLGVALMLNSWIVLLWPILVYPIWSILVQKEKKMMESIFGEEYRKYASRTGRFMPRFNRY
jgi:protein-S-isoprenylcysteine O-methyltransferase Ste14